MIGLIIFLIISSLSYGHSLSTEVEYTQAVIIKIKYSDGTPFSYERYEIYSPEDEIIPYQIGRTDREGRIIFVPDYTGKWKIKAFSEDGHGTVKYIELKKLVKGETDKDKADFFIKIFTGVFLIFFIYSVLYLTLRRGKIEKKD